MAKRRRRPGDILVTKPKKSSMSLATIVAGIGLLAVIAFVVVSIVTRPVVQSKTTATTNVNGVSIVAPDNVDALLRYKGLDPEKAFWGPIKAVVKYNNVTSGEIHYNFEDDCTLTHDESEADYSNYSFGFYDGDRTVNVNLCRPERVVAAGFPLNDQTIGQTVGHETQHSFNTTFSIKPFQAPTGSGTTISFTKRMGFLIQGNDNNGVLNTYRGLEEFAVHSCINTIVSEGGMSGFNPPNAEEQYQNFFIAVFGQNLSSACKQVMTWRGQTDGLQHFCATIMQHPQTACNRGEFLATTFLTGETIWINQPNSQKMDTLVANAADYNKRKYNNDSTPLSWDLN